MRESLNALKAEIAGLEKRMAASLKAAFRTGRWIWFFGLNGNYPNNRVYGKIIGTSVHRGSPQVLVQRVTTRNPKKFDPTTTPFRFLHPRKTDMESPPAK